MSLPYFYQKADLNQAQLDLDEATSRHMIQVLRMQVGEQCWLTDGHGSRALCRITLAHKKHCRVEVLERSVETPGSATFSIGIAFTKNKSRNEWLLEKLAELGTAHIYPLLCQRSEKEKFNPERYNNILISALIQSRQTFLPQLHAPQRLTSFVRDMQDKKQQKFIAHCLNDDKKLLFNVLEKDTDALILIGPEGDFTSGEIAQCLTNQFIPVTLGPNRLRTETAGIYACTAFNVFQYA